MSIFHTLEWIDTKTTDGNLVRMTRERVFVVWVALLLAASATSVAQELLAPPLGRLMAGCVGPALSLTGVPVRAEGALLVAPGARIRVGAECVALPAFATLLATELTLGWARLGWRVVAALGAFLALNTLRIFSVSLVYLEVRPAFDFVHDLLWNAVLAVFVTTFVVERLWPRKETAHAPRHA